MVRWIISIVLIGQLSGPMVLHGEEKSIGAVRKIVGSAWVDTLVEGKLTSKSVKLNMSLFQKDTIRTEAGGNVLIIFIDGSSMNIQESSKCKLTRFSVPEKKRSIFSSLFELTSGKIRLYLNKEIKGDRDAKVKTASTVMGIRGTDVFIGSNAGNDSIACVSCSKGKLPTIASLKNPKNIVSIENKGVRSFAGGRISKARPLSSALKASIGKSLSNASHRYAAAKSRKKTLAVKPRVVVEDVKIKKKKSGTNKSEEKPGAAEKTNANLLENYSESKEKARAEADKVATKKIFEEKKVEIRIRIE